MASINDIEAHLVESLRKGSVESFNIIYQMYAKKLLLYIANATRSKEDAEEIVHDIFLSLWKNHKNIKPDTNLSTFLFSIAYKRRVDFFRQTLNAPIYEDYTQFQNELTIEDDCALEYDEFCRIFNKALSSLPARIQTMLVLSRIKGLSVDEIAVKMNVSTKTVRNGISEGLRQLKAQLLKLMRSNGI